MHANRASSGPSSLKMWNSHLYYGEREPDLLQTRASPRLAGITAYSQAKEPAPALRLAWARCVDLKK